MVETAVETKIDDDVIIQILGVDVVRYEHMEQFTG